MSANTKEIESALENLSKKQHVVSDRAIQASMERKDRLSQNEKLGPQLEIFNHSVKLLVHLFRASHLDEMAQFIAHPARVLILNFLIGVVRGIGFLAGTIALLLFMKALLKDVPLLSMLGLG